MTPRIGSLCSGYGGLEMGLMAVVGGSVAWHAENDPNAAKVLDAHWRGVPNLGDITKIDWSDVDPVDIFCAGFPCQDISNAGHGAGITEGTRSGLWFTIADAIGVLRPRVVVLENVARIVTRRPGLDVVLASLAALGFDAEWGCVRASDAGAAHTRDRWFCVATDARGQRHGGGQNGRSVGRMDREDAGEAQERQRPRPVALHRDGETAPDTAGQGRERCEGSARQGGRRGLARSSGADGDAALSCISDEPVGSHAAGQHERPVIGAVPGDSAGTAAAGVPVLGRAAPVVAWGKYAGAIRRWERVTGRSAPDPTGDNYPRFVEWHMGLPEGWVVDVLPRNPALKCLGNGVVPQQAALAVRTLLNVGSVAA